MNQMLATTVSLLIGGVVMVNGVFAKTDDIVADATKAVNGANFHQIATVLEVYYSDYNRYPDAKNAAELMDIFEREGYIRNRPLDPNVFIYEATKNNQDYKLAMAE